MVRYQFHVTASRPRDQIGQRERSRGYIDIFADDEQEARQKARRKTEAVFPGWLVQLRLRKDTQ